MTLAGLDFSRAYYLISAARARGAGAAFVREGIGAIIPQVSGVCFDVPKGDFPAASCLLQDLFRVAG